MFATFPSGSEMDRNIFRAPILTVPAISSAVLLVFGE